MIQVKLFDFEHEEDLEEEVNVFLTQIHESNIIDVKYQVSLAIDEQTDDLEPLYSFSAMVLYRK